MMDKMDSDILGPYTGRGFLFHNNMTALKADLCAETRYMTGSKGT